MKKIGSTLAIALVFFIGLSILLYPSISNWLMDQSTSYAIATYQEESIIQEEDTNLLAFEQARAYNATLTGDVHGFLLAEDTTATDTVYWNCLNVVDGIMGFIDIPSIGVSLPIYHGTEETVLQKGVGHMEGTALPTGDLGNNVVLTGHTGLPSAELFTNMDEMVVGDRFTLSILNQVFTYEVKDIYVVLPTEVEELEAKDGRDLVTLVTCTPYGVNSHRLLLQSERVDTLSAVVPDNQPVLEAVEEKSNFFETNLTVIYFTMTCLFLFLVLVVTLCFKHLDKANRTPKEETPSEKKRKIQRKR